MDNEEIIEELKSADETEKKEIEVVTGDGSELNISDVHEHLTALRPKTNDKKNIVIPEVKKEEKSDDSEDN